MPRRLIIVFVLAFVVIPLSVSAQETCTCYCAGPDGAQEVGSTKPEACAGACKQKGETQVMCGFGTQSPAASPICYTKSECEGQKDEKDRQAARWVGQARDCIGGQGYCTPIRYADIELSFKLGEVEKVSDLAQYIQLGYTLLLGVATTVAIVMVMVGGIQYVIGAGAPEQLMKAKNRIKNAVIGLALLMGAYVILFTVNPQLVKLEVPSLPMVKEVKLSTIHYLCGDYRTKDECLADARRVGGADGCIWEADVGGPALCGAKAAIGKNGFPCGQGCGPGLQCVHSIPFGGGSAQDVCSDYKNGSPCAESIECLENNSECRQSRCQPMTGVAEGKPCQEGSECMSGICDAITDICLSGNETTRCALASGGGDDDKCLPDYWCPDDSGAHCERDLDNGEACERDEQCLSENCADNPGIGTGDSCQ